MTGGRLLALAPLRIEARAVAAGAPSALVIRTGMGPSRAGRTADRLVAAGMTPAAVAVTGVCGALAEDLVPGDIVVASEVRGPGTTVTLPSAALVAAALRRAGLSVRVGPVVSTDHVVRGSERAALAATGAIAVDMESAALTAAVWNAPLAVVRAVSDTGSWGPVSPAILRDGLKACRALRQAAPILEAWAAAAGPRRILLAGPRSFCAGVDRAIETVERALDRFGAPVYVRKQIVHNRHVVAGLEAKGAVFVDELDEVPDNATLVFSAHGVAPSVRAEAARRQLAVIDATCPLVAKVHTEVRRFTAKGYQIVLIGHPDHDETVGTLGEAAEIQVVERPEDVANVHAADPDRVAYITQTTLAVDEAAEIATALRTRYPSLVGPPADDICYASQNRQDAVRAIAPDCDLVLVVGSRNSSNSNRLVEVARRAGSRAELVDDSSEVDLAWLAGASTVGVTAGASAPEVLVERLVSTLGTLGPVGIEQQPVTTESVSFSLPLEVR
ncbi:MAG TPA: 4-hydroxy-3-methylbut-2-enyl diphosphate reductase [Acidimicrobiales bacterium]|nr:4-hydroxy-3-methylbut-2-enyl diphosphate reductase [Acidimicrobiales bacterium]